MSLDTITPSDLVETKKKAPVALKRHSPSEEGTMRHKLDATAAARLVDAIEKSKMDNDTLAALAGIDEKHLGIIEKARTGKLKELSSDEFGSFCWLVAHLGLSKDDFASK